MVERSLPQLMPWVRLPGTGQLDFTFQVFLLTVKMARAGGQA
jgi:hypothetical protein